MSNFNTDNTTSNKPGTWRVLSSMKARMFTAFTLLFALSLVTFQLIEHYGIPFTPYSGRVFKEKVTAFKSLSLTADLKKERLENSLVEFKNDIQLFSMDFQLRKSVYILEKEMLAFQDQIRSTPAVVRKLRTKASFHIIKQYLDRIKSTYPAYGRVDVLNVETPMILISTDSAKEGTEIFDYPAFFTTDIEPQDPTIAMWKLKQAGRPTLTIAYPILELGEERFSSTFLLVIYINTDTILSPLLHTGGGLGETGEALLIDQNRNILTTLKHSLPDGTIAKPFEYQIIAEPARRAAGGEEGIISSNDYRGIPVLAAYRYIPISADVGWGMVVKRDESEIFRSFRQSEFQLVLIGIIFILLTILITTLLADSLTRPLDKLSRTAQLIELGNLDVRAEVAGTGETRTLAEAINSMLDRFQDWNEDLDRQVQQRTLQLKDKNQELEQIVYVTSHDLRSPLVNIQGFSSELAGIFKRVDELASKEKLSDEDRGELDSLLNNEAPESLNYIHRSVEKMDILLKGLLKLSRLGRAALEIGILDMNTLMKEVAASFEFQIKDRSATLVVENLPPAMGDKHQINQVFSNLIENALKYFDPDRKITIRISSEQKEDQVVYCVSDNGQGFSDEFTNKVFEIFHRLEPAKSSGDGLGLSIVRKIVEKHRGTTWAESEPGTGSKFFVSLPSV